MRPYTAHPVAISGSGVSPRAAPAVPLWDVVSAQIAPAQQCQMPPPTDTKINIIIAPDATPLWRTSATRCAGYVHMWGPPRRARDVRQWATWRALDGLDNGRCVCAIDRLTGPNTEVEDLERDRDVMWEGRRYTFEVVLTGDGMPILLGNLGQKFWVCANVSAMVPTVFFFRLGAGGALFLPSSHQSVALVIIKSAPALL